MYAIAQEGTFSFIVSFIIIIFNVTVMDIGESFYLCLHYGY